MDRNNRLRAAAICLERAELATTDHWRAVWRAEAMRLARAA